MIIVLEWSVSQNCFHVHRSLDDCVKTNLTNIAQGISTDFVPIAFLATESLLEDAMAQFHKDLQAYQEEL